MGAKITLKTDPDPLIVKVGETKKLSIVALDEQGKILDGEKFDYQMLRQEGFVPTSGAQIDLKLALTICGSKTIFYMWHTTTEV